MQLIGLTSAATLTTLTLTLSAIPGWSQTNQNSFTCFSTSHTGCVEQIPTRLGLTPESGKYQRIIAWETNSLPPTVQISHNDTEGLIIKSSQVVSQSSPGFGRVLAETHFNRGNDYYKEEKWDLALADYTRAVAIDSNYADAYNNRGNVYLNQKKWDLAVADYTRAITINPNLAEAYNNRGLAYHQLEDFNKARENFQRAAQLHLAQGNTAAYQDTIKLVNSLERSGRALVETYFNRGNHYYKEEKWDLAVADYTRAIAINPNLAEAYYNRGFIYNKLQKWDLAVADFTQFIRLNPNNADAYINRGLVYEEQQRWDLAVADYTRSLAINPNLARVYINRGLIYSRLGDINKAKGNLQRAAELFLTQGRMGDYLGVITLLSLL